MARLMGGLFFLLISLVVPNIGTSATDLSAVIETFTKGTDTVVRIAAAKRLGKTGSPRAMDVLVKALDDANRPVRWAAIEALGELGRKQAVPVLLQYFERKEAYRWGDILTVNALAAIGDRRAVPRLMKFLKAGTDPIFHRVVILALGQLEDPRAISPVMVFLKDERRWLRKAARLSLIQLAKDRLQGDVPRGYAAWSEWHNKHSQRSAASRKK